MENQTKNYKMLAGKGQR